MEWTDEGIVIGTRRHGEAGVIVDLFTETRGRHLGIVRGGQSARMRAALQIGNGVRATWRARLEDHLGAFSIEPVRFRAADLIQSPALLFAAQTAAAHARLLPERDPHPELLAWFDVVLAAETAMDAAMHLSRMEVQLLADLGFGLDLDQCAATGGSTDLVYVSPKSGRAVSAEAGAPYRGKLLALPAFLTGDDPARPIAPEDIASAFALTGYFLDRHVYGPRAIVPPTERGRLLRLVAADAA